MKPLEWYRRDLDWARQDRDLTLAERGALVSLEDLQASQPRDDVPADPEDLAGMIGARAPGDVEVIRRVLARLKRTGGRRQACYSARIRAERRRVEGLRQTASKAGKISAAKRSEATPVQRPFNDRFARAMRGDERRGDETTTEGDNGRLPSSSVACAPEEAEAVEALMRHFAWQDRGRALEVVRHVGHTRQTIEEWGRYVSAARIPPAMANRALQELRTPPIPGVAERCRECGGSLGADEVKDRDGSRFCSPGCANARFK